MCLYHGRTWGKKNPLAVYSIGATVLDRTTEEKDLGILLADDYKMSKQCGQAAVKAKKILGCIIRGKWRS